MFWLLLRLRFAALFSAFLAKKNRKKSIFLAVLLSMLLLYVVAAVVGFLALLAFALAPRFVEADASFAYFAVGGGLAFLVMLLGSVMFTQNQLYVANDNEFLLAMPVPPNILLLSRLSFLLVINVFLEALVALPLLVAWFFVGAPTFLGTVAAILVLLLLPLLSLAVSCLLGWCIAKISARMRHKSIVALLLSVVLVVAYFAFIFSMDYVMGDIDDLSIEPVVEAMTSILPLRLLGRAMTGAILPLLLVIAVAGGLVAGIFYWLFRTFLSTVLERPRKAQVSYRARRQKTKSPLWALTVRELRHLGASSGYMMNAGMGLLFCLLLPLALFIFIVMDAEPGQEGTLVLVLNEAPILARLLAPAALAATTACLSMAIFSACTVSLEGPSLWIIRTSPVPARTALLAKVIYHLIPTLPVMAVSLLLYAIPLHLSWYETLLLLFAGTAYVLFSSAFGLLMNLLFPKLEWKNEMVAIKQGAAIMLAMIGSGAAAGAGAVLLIIFSLFLPTWIALLLYFLGFGALSLGLVALLMSVGARRFETI